MSPTGYEVPDDKSENPEDWISTSYEDIVKILRSILELDIDQKVQYIIGDYIKLLEERQIVEDVNLEKILSSLCAKHKDAIDLLLEYRNKREGEQSVIRRVREIFKEIFQEYGKIFCIKETTYTLRFNTTSMNKYFPPVQDKSGSYEDGTKYKYWINLKDKKCPPPSIVLELGSSGQDDDIIRKMNLLIKSANIKKEVTASDDKYTQTKHWKMNNIDWTLDSLEDLNKNEYLQDMKAEIRKTLDEIFIWEETEEIKNILK